MSLMVPQGRRLILGSQSPRRAQLLAGLGLSFEQRSADIDESHSPSLRGAKIAIHLAEEKARALRKNLPSDAILLTSDTVVWDGKQSLVKPKDATEAHAILEHLSNKSHQVISALCFCDKDQFFSLSDTTQVFFKTLSSPEIAYYVKNYRPYDKAGAYGIQEWIGMIGIEKIEGSYFTVMGLPTHLVFPALARFSASD